MKKKLLFIFISVSVIALVLVFAYSSGKSLQEYKPKNRDEAEIVALLLQFESAKQQFDLERYLFCLEENGRYMFAGHLMVSKDELRALLPEFWNRLKAKNTHAQPISRENLNGNYLNGSFYNPIITVTDDSAEVTVTFQTPNIKWRTLLFLHLVRKMAGGSSISISGIWDNDVYEKI